MAINHESASDVGINGYGVKDDNGDTVFYLTHNAGDPTGSPAPADTWIFNTATKTIWYKFGAGNNDWRQIRANDIAYDVTSALPNSPDLTGVTQIKQALDAFANRHFGKDSAFDQADGPFSTTSATPVVVFSVPLNVSADPSGTYRLGWNAQDVSSKSNTTGLVEFVVDSGLPSEIVVATGLISFIETKFSGFDSGIIANGARTLDLRISRATGNGTVSLSDVSVEAWRAL